MIVVAIAFNAGLHVESDGQERVGHVVVPSTDGLVDSRDKHERRRLCEWDALAWRIITGGGCYSAGSAIAYVVEYLMS